MTQNNPILHYLGSITPGVWIAIILSFVIGILQLISSHWIREEESNHPAYKIEKGVWGAVFIGSGINLLVGSSTFSIWFRNFTSFLIVGAAVVAFFFIRYRKNNPLFRVVRLRTQKGVVESGSFKENNQKASEVSALIRHDRSGGGEVKLLSDWSIAEIEEALKTPLKEEWVEERREILRQRREAAAKQGEIVEVDPPEGV